MLPGNSINSGDHLISMYDLGELSSIHSLGSTSTLPSKTSLKSHRANNLNIVEVEGASRRANDVSLGECQAAGIHPVPLSPYSSPSVLNQQPLLSNNNGNSNSDPLLCASTSSMANVKQYRLVNDLSVMDGEASQRCANDVSPGECQIASTVHSTSSFFLSPVINLSSNSSSSSSDSGVSFLRYRHLLYAEKNSLCACVGAERT